MIEKLPNNASISDPGKIEEFIEKFKTGEIYGEIQNQLEENLRKRKSRNGGRRDKNIELLQEKIAKKEQDVTRILGEIIKLKNDLSMALEKELDSPNTPIDSHPDLGYK